jgi:uncharacterized damage-inducible protein DinB
MSEMLRIVDQLKRIYDGPAWHGPSLKKLLAEVTVEAAAARPLPGAHSIWELVLHITSWEAAAAAALRGAAMPSMPWAEDWPRISDGSREAWERDKESLKRTHEKLIAAAKNLSDDRLPEVVAGRKYDFYFLLHGMAQHAAYHGGQIALLMKG